MTPDQHLICNILAGMEHYGVVTLVRKKRVKGCKYMGQMPIYVMRKEPGFAIHRVPRYLTDEFLDKLSKMEYDGLREVGPKVIPVFKEQDDTSV